MEAVEVDVPETWPARLVALHEGARPDLLAWRDRQREIDELCERDVMARLDPPANPHAAAAEQFAAAVDEVLGPYRLLCRHCTRLHRTDVERIESAGVLPLSVALTRDRLEKLHTAGEITDAEMQLLQRRSQSDQRNRRDRTFWILGRGPLREFGGVYRLFASWGGEAMYWAHEGKPLGHRLSSLGEPAIIEAAIPYAMLDATWTVGERLRDALADGRPPEFTAVTRAPVPAGYITRLLFHGSVDFEQLTGVSTWPLCL